MDLRPFWRIHRVISLAHLEAATKPEDDQCSRPDQLEAVTVDGGPEWEIKKLLATRSYRKERGYRMEYLARWKSLTDIQGRERSICVPADLFRLLPILGEVHDQKPLSDRGSSLNS